MRDAGLLRLRLFLDYACFSTSVRRECDETVELRKRRQSATASVEEIFLLAPGTFRCSIMLVNFTDQGLKDVKDVPNNEA